MNYDSFIAPAVGNCTLCGTALTALNPLGSFTLYTVDSPQSCTTLRLRCQGCKLFYGRSMRLYSSGNAWFLLCQGNKPTKIRAWPTVARSSGRTEKALINEISYPQKVKKHDCFSVFNI